MSDLIKEIIYKKRYPKCASAFGKNFTNSIRTSFHPLCIKSEDVKVNLYFNAIQRNIIDKILCRQRYIIVDSSHQLRNQSLLNNDDFDIDVSHLKFKFSNYENLRIIEMGFDAD